MRSAPATRAPAGRVESCSERLAVGISLLTFQTAVPDLQRRQDPLPTCLGKLGFSELSLLPVQLGTLSLSKPDCPKAAVGPSAGRDAGRRSPTGTYCRSLLCRAACRRQAAGLAACELGSAYLPPSLGGLNTRPDMLPECVSTAAALMQAYPRNT